MNVEKVQLTVSSIKELLNSGYTWLKKDDLGYGSIQEKFQASDVQIITIRKHPALKDADTVAKIFIIVDDSKNEPNNNTTVSTDQPGNEEPLECVPGTDRRESEQVSGQLPNSKRSNGETVSETVTDSFDAFANL